MSTPASPSAAARTQRCQILLVHDDPAIQAALGALLATDILFEAVSTATEGLDRLYTIRPELVILDAALPDLNGFHFLQVLRSYVPTCPVILITSSHAQVTHHITAFGIAGCWSRPSQLDALLAQLSLLPPSLHHPRLLALRGNPHASKAIDYIGRHYAQPLTVSAIATALHVSPGHLASVFRRATGMTVKAYLTQVRLEVAKRLLATTDVTIEGLAERTGFCDASHALTRAACPPSPLERASLGLRETSDVWRTIPPRMGGTEATPPDPSATHPLGRAPALTGNA